MSAQTVSWSHLETLLNEATVKRTIVTPKSKTITFDDNHPHMLKCIRYKKNRRDFQHSSQSSKYKEITTSARDKVSVETFATPVKSKTDLTRAQTSIRLAQKSSLQNLDQLSDISDEIKDFLADNNAESVEAPKFRRVGSMKAFESPGANRWSDFPRGHAYRQSCIESTLMFKKLESVCGIEEFQLRELYRLKCQDLKIGVFPDSEDGFIQGLKKKSYENKLHLYESGFGPRALERLGQIIRDNSEIVHLCLRKSALNGMTIRSFARNLAAMPCLIHLELANNSLEPQDISILLEELSESQSIVSIDLSNYEPDKKNRFTVECLDSFHMFVHGNKNLQFVNLTNLMLEDEVVQGIIAALEGSPHLLSLNLSSNSFTGKSLERLPFLLSQTLIQRLDLSNNKLKKEGATHISKSIQGFKGADREGLDLNLDNTQIGADANTIFAALGKETNVAKLNLSNNALYNVEIIRLETALSESTKLLELNLSHCKIGEMGGALLALGLKKNTSLQNVILSNNDIGDAVGAQILYALDQNHLIKAIDISHNKLASESAKALQEIVKKNPNIEKYNLSMNKFDENEGYLLQEALYFSAKITQFNLHHNPVKYNTIETVERIVKDNLRKLTFHAVPNLKDEVARKRDFIEDEKYAIEEVVHMERVKVDMRRDVDKFQKTLTSLKNRTESPTIKRNEKTVVKLGKEIRDQNREYNECIQKYREFRDEAFMEKEGYTNELESVSNQLKNCNKKVEVKKKELEKIMDTYEPEVKRLRLEISKLTEDNRFLELYNDTLLKKIRKEKKKAVLASRVSNPKISDMFLATSELARHKKKNETVDKTYQDSRSKIGGVESNSHFSQPSDESRITKEYTFALKNQHFRIHKQFKENERKDSKFKKKKKGGKGDASEDDVKIRIKEKIRDLLKDTELAHGSILAQITDN